MPGEALINSPDLWLNQFPVPHAKQNKYDRGHVLVASGGLASTGAARLAARGALRAGAGLVTLASPKDALLVNAATSLAVMVRAFEDANEFSNLLAGRQINAAVLGPGGGIGPDMCRLVMTALESNAALVLDADALTSFSGHLVSLAAAIKQRTQPTILTPHEGEFARLFQDKKISRLSSKSERALAAAKETGAIIVLKGANTVIASADGHSTIAENAPPWLATAGSGDVLAGMIAGLLAQGMPGFMAASAAVWLHGEAANIFGPGLIAEDLPEMLPAIYRKLLAL